MFSRYIVRHVWSWFGARDRHSGHVTEVLLQKYDVISTLDWSDYPQKPLRYCYFQNHYLSVWRPVLVKIMTIKLHRKSVLIQLQQILWTCCVFLSSLNNTFFSVFVIILSNKSYFCFNYRNTFFIHAVNYFSLVLRIIFLIYIKNYFLIGPRIIFRGIANLFFGLQCIEGLKLTARRSSRVVNVGSLEKRSNQPKYKDKNKKSKDYCKADLKQRVLFFITILQVYSCYCGPCIWSGLVRVFDFLGRPFWKLCKWRSAFKGNAKAKHCGKKRNIGKKTKEVFIFLTKSVRS